jgi:hypothetical protein
VPVATAEGGSDLPQRGVAEPGGEPYREVGDLPGGYPAAFIATPRQRPHLLTLSRLPRTGLQSFLNHVDPDVRALAAADTTLDQPPIHLLTDPQARVRQAAAASPLLPPDLISTLLEDPETAEGAAANPSVSPERLHELLDLSGLTRATVQ